VIQAVEQKADDDAEDEVHRAAFRVMYSAMMMPRMRPSQCPPMKSVTIIGGLLSEAGGGRCGDHEPKPGLLEDEHDYQGEDDGARHLIVQGGVNRVHGGLLL
jgi:hypothetical protein